MKLQLTGILEIKENESKEREQPTQIFPSYLPSIPKSKLENIRRKMKCVPELSRFPNWLTAACSVDGGPR
jgi:hypothetical protein